MINLTMLDRMYAERAATVITADNAGQIGRADRADRARRRVERKRERVRAEQAELEELHSSQRAVRFDPEVHARHSEIMTAALTKLRGIPLPLDPRELLVLARDGGVLLLDVLVGIPALRALNLGDIVDVIGGSRGSRPLEIPIIVIVEGWATLAWTDCVPLSAGGLS